MSSPRRISPPAHVKGQLTVEESPLTPAEAWGRVEALDDGIVHSENLSTLSIFCKHRIIRLVTYPDVFPISMVLKSWCWGLPGRSSPNLWKKEWSVSKGSWPEDFAWPLASSWEGLDTD